MENWKDIPGYEGLYIISDIGNIKYADGNGSANHPNTLLLKPILNKDGYNVISLSKNKIKKQHRIHRLVASAFIPNPKNKPFINHINAIKNDNRVVNLEWCTQKENIAHCWKLGNAKPGEHNGNSKLKSEQVLMIRKIKSENKISNKSIADMFGIEQTTVAHIIKRKTWKHL